MDGTLANFFFKRETRRSSASFPREANEPKERILGLPDGGHTANIHVIEGNHLARQKLVQLQAALLRLCRVSMVLCGLPGQVCHSAMQVLRVRKQPR